MKEGLPRGWVTRTIREIATKVGSGATPSGGSASYHSHGTPLIRSMNVHFTGFDFSGLAFIDEEQAKVLDNVFVESGDVLLNITGASIGRVCTAPSEMQGARVNQHVCIIRTIEAISSEFLRWFLASPEQQKMIMDTEAGATRQALTKAKILDFEVPFPPLGEQRRIVAKLEALLAKVDTSRKRLERIPAILKRFRQAVLAAACEGRLTEDWRAANAGILSVQSGELPPGWVWTRVDELLPKGGIFDGPFGSNLKTSDYTETGVRVIRLENVSNLHFKGGKETYISHEKYEALKRHTVMPGDIIFGSFVDEATRVCILPNLSTPAIAKADCFCIRPNQKLVRNGFLAMQLASRESHDRLVSEVHGATRPRVNTTQLRTLEILLCSLPEQDEILSRVKNLFTLADQIEARYLKAKTHLDRLTQSILAKAFRGELVPQDPDDEPAEQLLARLHSEAAVIPAASRRHGRSAAPRASAESSSGRRSPSSQAGQTDTIPKRRGRPRKIPSGG